MTALHQPEQPDTDDTPVAFRDGGETGMSSWPPREVVVPILVLGSLLVAVAVSVAVGVDRPYPGVALGSGLLLELERAVAVWVIVLLVLVVGDQALRGRLPDEIGGRGVRYVAQQQLDEAVERTTEAGNDLAYRIGAVEIALEALGKRSEQS